MKQKLTLEEIRAQKKEQERAYKAKRDELADTEKELEKVKSAKNKKGVKRQPPVNKRTEEIPIDSTEPEEAPKEPKPKEEREEFSAAIKEKNKETWDYVIVPTGNKEIDEAMQDLVVATKIQLVSVKDPEQRQKFIQVREEQLEKLRLSAGLSFNLETSKAIKPEKEKVSPAPEEESIPNKTIPEIMPETVEETAPEEPKAEESILNQIIEESKQKSKEAGTEFEKAALDYMQSTGLLKGLSKKTIDTLLARSQGRDLDAKASMRFLQDPYEILRNDLRRLKANKQDVKTKAAIRKINSVLKNLFKRDNSGVPKKAHKSLDPYSKEELEAVVKILEQKNTAPEQGPVFNAEEFETKIREADSLEKIYWILKEQKTIPCSEGDVSGEIMAKGIYNLFYMAPEILNTREKADKYLADKGITRNFGLRAKVMGLIMFDLNTPEQNQTAPEEEKIDYAEKIKELEALLAGMQSQNLYERLGLTPGATKNQIEKAYKQKLKDFHPDDKPAELRDLYNELCKLVGEAGNTLKDDRAKDKYDFDMAFGHRQTGQNTPPPGTPPTPDNGPQAPGANDPLINMEQAREKYATAYKEFIQKKKSERNFLVRGLKKFTGWQFEDKDLNQELKDLESEYNRALVALGNSMYAAKAQELMNARVVGVDKDNELKRYKQNEIFTEVVIKEQARLSALKAENLPVKERGVLGKGLDWYLRQPRWAKIAISTALTTAVFASFVPGSVAAAGGAVGFAGMRFARGLTSSTVGQLAAKSVDFIWKDKSAAERKAGEQALAQAFGDNDLGDILESTKKNLSALSEAERSARRNRLLTKAVVGLVAGGATSFTMSYASHIYASPEEIPNMAPKNNMGAMDKLRSKLFDQYETKAKTELNHQPSASPNIKAPVSPGEQAVSSTPGSTTAPTEAINAKPFTLNQDAVIQKGEGIEHAFRRQIMHNEALAKQLGWDGKESIEKFSGSAAHRVAIDHGYVDKVTGEEIRIRGAGSIAYQTELGPNGEVKVSEYIIKDGKVIDQSIGNNAFEHGADVQDHEYTYKAGAVEHTTAKGGGVEDLKTSGKNIQEGSGVKATASEHIAGDEAKIRDLRQQMEEAYKNGEVHDNIKTAPEPEVNKVHTGTRVHTGTKISTGRFANAHLSDKPGGENVIYRGLGSHVDRGQDHVFANLEDHEIAALENHPAFMSNPYELSDERLVQVYDTGMRNLREIFEASTNDHIWSSLRGENVKRILEYKLVASDDPAVGKLANYFNNLKTWSGLEPKSATVFRWRPESSEEFLARALQKICASGKLEQFEASLNK